MIPLWHEPTYRFRFAEPRLIDRCHLDGVTAGVRVTVHCHPRGESSPMVAIVGDGGWLAFVPARIVDATIGFDVEILTP